MNFKWLQLSFLTFLLIQTIDLYSQSWELVWSDEFDYTGAPDVSKWSFDTQGNNWDWGNAEAQNYTPASENNAWVDGDALIIEARKEQYTWSGDNETKEYTSARLITSGKGDWLYGKVEVRALLPKGRGMWPAIWMLPTDWEYGDWPASGELDIMENVGYDPLELHCNIHTQSYHHSTGTNKGGTKTITDPNVNWHVYSMEWNAEHVSFYCDGDLVFSFDKEHNTYKEWPFDKRFHLILNIAVGGSWGGLQGIDDSVFPQQMKVDYVRVYQHGVDPVVQTPYHGDPVILPGKVEAEDYDNGGAGVAYYDDSQGNEGATYRSESVDIGGTDAVGYSVGWFNSDEWLEYTIDVKETGTYALSLLTATEENNGAYSISINGDPIIQNATVTNTGNWSVWEQQKDELLFLEAGEHVIRLTCTTGPFNVDYLDFTLNSLTQSIPLQEGWNLVALYVDPEEKRIASLFPDAICVKDYQNVWFSDKYSYLSSFDSFVPQNGYWVQQTRTDTLEVLGEYIPVVVQIKSNTAGWKLIGINENIVVDSLPSDVKTIKDLDSFYERGSSYTSLDTLYRGKAYYILFD